jgi:lysophospholipase L1-like esterase
MSPAKPRTLRIVATLGPALAALVAGAAWAVGPDSRPTTPDPARFADEIGRFVEWDRRNAWPRDAILFVGSSSIRMWATRESFPQWPVINRGFGGSHIRDINHYFKQVVEPYRARVIVFYAGDNDIAAGVAPEQARDDFAAFVRLVRAAQPETPIVFLSIKPSKDRWAYWPRMQEANALIRALAEQDGTLTCVDVGTPLLGAGGEPRPELYKSDKLHLNDAGYEVWTRTLTPVLEKLLRR